MARWDVTTKEYKEFEEWAAPPQGVIPARVCAFIDIGTQEDSDPKGAIYMRRCLWIGYELIELDSKNRPFFMSERITLSMGTNSTLYKYVQALHGEVAVGEALDTNWVANKPCLIQITHDVKIKNGKQRTYANIAGVMGCPRGTITPQGSCVVWRVADRHAMPLPNVDFLPPLWCPTVGKMLNVAEWINRSIEVCGRTQNVPNAADTRMPTNNTRVTHPEQDITKPAPKVYAEGEEIPF